MTFLFAEPSGHYHSDPAAAGPGPQPGGLRAGHSRLVRAKREDIPSCPLLGRDRRQSTCDLFPPIEERQERSGDRGEICETEHALLDLPRHRAELLQENAPREAAREAPYRPDEPQGEDEVPVEVMRCDGDDADEPLDKAALYLHVRDFLDLGMLETQEGDQDDADAGAEEPGVGAGRERRGVKGALRDALG